MAPADLSVVVAAQDGGSSLDRCLAAVAAQDLSGAIEIVVVDGSPQGLAERLRTHCPAAKLLRFAPPGNVPLLWAAGIRASTGAIVALTIENCAPAPDWARSMLALHARHDVSGIGGAIEIAPGAGTVDRAVYFCRYSAYMPPYAQKYLDDIPGDNCSYKRAALERVLDSMEPDGFWETFIHYEMRSRNERLLSDPTAVVHYTGGLRAWRFLNRRFLHGRYFAARRSKGFSAGQRFARALAFPLVAIMLLVRISGRVWRNGRHRAAFARALPLVALFLLSWAAGEAAGYLGIRLAVEPSGA